MGITERTFGKQQSTSDRIKQAVIWFCIIPQALAGWLVAIRYFDLFFLGGSYKFMGEMDRFWLHSGIFVLMIILAIQIIFVWTLRGAYHRVEHVKETRIVHEAESKQELELDHWVTAETERGSNTAIIREATNAQKLMQRFYEEPPNTVGECDHILQAMRMQKIDVTKEPWKKIHGGVMNKRKSLRRKHNRAIKDQVSGPSPLPLLD